MTFRASINMRPSLAAFNTADLLKAKTQLTPYQGVGAAVITDGSDNLCGYDSLLAADCFAPKVLPSFSRFYPRHTRPMAVKVLGNLFACSGVVADCKNLLIRKLGESTSFAVRCAKFAHHVLRIKFVGTKPKMVWIAASAVVARVANNHTFRDRAVCAFPRNAVRHVALSAHAELPIAVGEAIALPFSTALLVRWGDFAPKSFIHVAKHTAIQKVIQ